MIAGGPIASFPVASTIDDRRIVGSIARSKYRGVSGTFTVEGQIGASVYKGVEGDAEQVLIAQIGTSVYKGVSATFSGGIVGGVGTSVYKGVEGDANYFLEGVPDIVVSRGPCEEGHVLIRNKPVDIDVNVYRATMSQVSGNFSVLQRISFDMFTDTTLDCELNYKYKASFVFDGEKDGQPVSFESQKSVSKYTKHE